MTLAPLGICGCHFGDKPRAPAEDPPPDARRPQLKTRAELAAERAHEIKRGHVVPMAVPTVAAEKKPTPAPSPPPPPAAHPTKHSIQSDVLMVNGMALTMAQALYPLRDWIAQARQKLPPAKFPRALGRRIAAHVRNEVGTLLIYEKAFSKLDEQKKKMLDKMIEQRVAERVSRDFGDSQARFEEHLHRYGLTLEQYREMQKRRLLAQSYSHDTFAPQIHIRRDELLAYYRENLPKYTKEETREFLLIAAPFEKFLPEGMSWERAPRSAKARARLAAKRRIRQAQEALAHRSFADVAREFSAGIHAKEGGSWGEIGLPLRPPYEQLSKRIFSYHEGQHSQPIKTDTGWYIVGCGKIHHAERSSFEDVQDEIRTELENERFAKRANAYINRLARHATISNMRAFVQRAVDRVLAGWPEPTLESARR